MNSRTKSRPQRNMSVDNLDLDRLSLERERLDFERQKMLERERRLLDEEKMIKAERARLEAERKMIKQETEVNNRTRPIYEPPPSSQPSPMNARGGRPVVLPDLGDQSPRQRAFVEDAIGRGSKLVMATFDRVAQNAKELTVSRGEYLEVLDDAKNWWECRNVHQRVGYVPHTILSVVALDRGDGRDTYTSIHDNHAIPNGHAPGGSSKQGMLPDDAPSYVKERQGRRGEFRYF
ncbi:variant SH3 domain protein [Oesophagostomum dentatum]|uniref:Variant SH3 domain protein n=1 Tax=Oesophagostomum dentatum TaxID=61180 RepID=A0A0B1TK97_OESDE|nr:variant SH3 domain protein [Oesophagostomum dentatum]